MQTINDLIQSKGTSFMHNGQSSRYLKFTPDMVWTTSCVRSGSCNLTMKCSECSKPKLPVICVDNVPMFLTRESTVINRIPFDLTDDFFFVQVEDGEISFMSEKDFRSKFSLDT